MCMVMGNEVRILKSHLPELEVNTECLKRQYFGHLMRTADSLEKTLMLGRIEGRRRRGRQRMGWLGGITDSVVRDREAWRAASPQGCKELDTMTEQEQL